MRAIPLIPYFETSRYRVETMVELSEVKSGERVADLGSGDGRISIAFAQKNASVTGFEIDARYISLAKENCQKASVEKKVTFINKNFWNEDLSVFDIIAIYPMPDIMEQLEKKLQHELRPGTRILLNYYMFTTWQYEDTKDNIYLYRK